MEVILTVSHRREVIDVLVRPKASFARLLMKFPDARAISWHTLAPGNSCVYSALPRFGLDGSMRLVAEVDGLWGVEYAFDA